MNVSNAVIGAGFGDEGKGMVVDYLCQKLKRPLVVRYCGGQQAGHQVVVDEKTSHVFSSFGSGTLRGIPTYWFPECTIDPVALLVELDMLMKMGIEPELYIDRRCPVTTPYDIGAGRIAESQNAHGSCGLGINATYRREENFYHLKFEDLFYQSVLHEKLKLIAKHYKCEYDTEYVKNFLNASFIITNNPFVKMAPDNLTKDRKGKEFKSLIYEGSQGLLLDQHNGFFPHVTPSNTGSRNFVQYTPFPWIVTRAYHTRHGNGPHPTEHIPHNIKPNPFEQNFDDSPQGKFRVGLLDYDWLEYGIYKDAYLRNVPFNLVITCLDCIENEWRLIHDGEIIYFDDEDQFVSWIFFTLKRKFKIVDVFISHSPISSKMKRWK